MYPWITDTWNTIKGACPHDCSYCYMKRFGKQPSVRFDESELKTDLGSDNFIFVGSSCDMFADKIPEHWIFDTINHCDKFENRYLFQTKNPKNIRRIMPLNTNICVTVETNRHYPEIMQNSPKPFDRFNEMVLIRQPLYITIEPIMDFDLQEFVNLIAGCSPVQVNIGADSGGNNLPEPSKEKILELINELERFTIVKQKKNLKRLIK